MRTEEQHLLALLTQLRAADWHTLIVDWCTRFHGWRADEAEDDSIGERDYEPLMQVIAALETLLPESATCIDIKIATAFAGCEFQRWQACLTSGRKLRWRPHQESYIQFRAHGPVQRWVDTEPLYSQEMLRGFILGQLSIRRQTDCQIGAHAGQRDPRAH